MGGRAASAGGPHGACASREAAVGSQAPSSRSALTSYRALHASTVLISFSKSTIKCIFLTGINFIVFLPPFPGTHPHLISRCFPSRGIAGT